MTNTSAQNNEEVLHLSLRVKSLKQNIAIAEAANDTYRAHLLRLELLLTMDAINAATLGSL